MAEQVQATLDQMVAPLANLLDRDLFSQSEIQSIVARRRESEYLLRRRIGRKADHLRYIQDELLLEKLRQLRTRKQQALERERLAKLGRLEKPKKEKDIGDTHVIHHIHYLFRRMLRRYSRGDVSIYLQYADVCKDLRSYNILPRVYAEALHIYPLCAELWIDAASHEFFHRQSVSAARILLQRALRINATSKDLWHQSFALELHLIVKMLGRRRLLDTSCDGETATLTAGTKGDRKNTSNQDSSILLAVPKIIFDGAIQAIPADVAFRLGFLDLCKSFLFARRMETYIFDTIRRNFRSDPQAWIARATHVMKQQQSVVEGAAAPKGFALAPTGSSAPEDGDCNLQKCSKHHCNGGEKASKKRKLQEGICGNPVLATVQEAIRTVASTEMYLESVQFLWTYWDEAEQIPEKNKRITTRHKVLKFLHEVLEAAASSTLGLYNDVLALKHADFYMRVGQAERGCQVVADYLRREKRTSGKSLTTVWLHHAELTFRVRNIAAARDVLKEAIGHAPVNHPDYVGLLLHLLGSELSAATMNDDATGKSTRAAMETFRSILCLLPMPLQEDEPELGTSFGLSSVEHACLQVLLYLMDTVEPLYAVRKTCKMILRESNFVESHVAEKATNVEALVAFFDLCLEVEIDNLKSSNKSQSQRKKDRFCLRELFDAALRVFRNEPSLISKYRQEKHCALLL